MRLPYRFGRYTLLEKIACGGTAEVYRAVLNAEEGFAKTVAVKRLLPAWCGSDDFERMLIDEGRVLTHLTHGAIVQVMELGRIEGMPFLAMEFVDGIDAARLLSELIRDREPLPPPHALYLIGQVLLALAFAHRAAGGDGRPLNIVHRDVSPSNILLSWNGEVKVTDFGIAKGLHRSRETRVGQLKGKYAYMAPEQARGEPIDARADLFACGVVLFELLTARRLFDGEGDLEVLELVRQARLPHEAIAPLPAKVRAVLILALSPDRGHRYQGAGEMLADIGRTARSLGEPTASIEFAQFLRVRFPPGRTLFVPVGAAATAEEPKTRPLASPPLPAAAVRRRGWRRAAGIATLLGAMVFLPPAKGTGEAMAPLETMIPSAQGGGAGGERPAGHPGGHRGAIAVDSVPSGARGILRLGSKRQEVTTPFSIEGIDLGDGIDGTIEISARGYQSVRQSFALEPSQPAFVKEIVLDRERFASLSVQARPWALVDIAGAVAGRETPISNLKLKAGSYAVQAFHPPSGRKVAGSVVLAGGEAKRCLATFDDHPSLQCR